MSNSPPSRDRRSLQDLAKLASSPSLTPPPPRTASNAPPPVASGSLIPSARTSIPASGPVSKAPVSKAPAIDELEHDSGIVDLKMIAQADDGATVRAQSTPLASAPLFDEGDETPARASAHPSTRPSSRASAAPSSAKGLPAAAASTPAIAAATPARSSAVAAAGATPQGSSRGVLIGIGLLLVAVGVGAFFMMRGSNAPKAEATVDGPASAPTPAAPQAPAASPTVAANAPSPAGAVADPPAAASEPAPAANAEPRAAVAGGHPAVRRGSAAAKPVVAGGGGSTVSPLSAMMAQSTAPAAPPATPTEPGGLGAAVQNAVGGGGAAAAPAGEAPAAPHYALGSVPQKPSQGTITSALGAVLPTARSCINPDDPISRAHITFASAGNVSAVTVTGHAAGTPAEGCIKGALMKASVPAFADETYGATVTIRPN